MQFPEAERRLFHLMICRKCNAHNPWRATLCRKCGGHDLRKKKAEKKTAAA